MAVRRPGRGGAAPEPSPAEQAPATPAAESTPEPGDTGVTKLLLYVTTGSLLIALILINIELKKYGAGLFG